MQEHSEAIRVIHGDCLEVMATLPDASVDAVITDPPYCSGGATEASRGRAIGQGLRNETITRGRFKWFDTDNMTTPGLMYLMRCIALDVCRLLRPASSFLVFTDWRMFPVIVPVIESAGFRYQACVVWDKGSMGLGRGFRRRHELIAHFTNGQPKYHDASTGDVIHAPRVRLGREHPTEKPVALLESLIRVVTPPGGVILDPFAGSGTTGIAAVNLGRRAILIERDANYCDIARRRLSRDDAATGGTDAA